jgi:hypothetical protein
MLVEQTLHVGYLLLGENKPLGTVLYGLILSASNNR